MSKEIKRGTLRGDSTAGIYRSSSLRIRILRAIPLLILTATVALLSDACKSDFGNIKSKSRLDSGGKATEKEITTLLIGAYSMLDGTSSSFGWEALSSSWIFGDIRGMIGNKGTIPDDQLDINSIQSFSETPSNDFLNVKWRAIYESISRCNSVILTTHQALADGTITKEQADLFVKQARALRGWYHFEAWRLWKEIPYVDENTDQSSLTNRTDIRNLIVADLEEGVSLPDNMGQIGLFNGTVSKVLLARVKISAMKDFEGALVLLNDAKQGTKPNGAPIGLAPTYGEIFDIVNRNGIEAVYTVQYSVNDGSGGQPVGGDQSLSFPFRSSGSPGGYVGFIHPTQEFVNSFRTSSGLPLLDNSYNDHPVKSDYGLTSSQPFNEDTGPLDPRLDWTVGRRGIPFWDWGIHPGEEWIPDQFYAGPYCPKKQVNKKSQEGHYVEAGSWTSGWTSNGYRMIRYADILLLIAECEIELNDLQGARENINLVRARAANPAGFVKEEDGITNAANYVIKQYPESGYPFDNQENARLALRMERKLELGMEGHRWFDLNEWGITQPELNRVLDYEKTMPWGGKMYGDAVVGPEDVTFPIPQRQIDESGGHLVQNR